MDTVKIEDPELMKVIKQLIKDGHVGSGTGRLQVLGQPGKDVYLVKGGRHPEYKALFASLELATKALLATLKKHKVHKEVHSAVGDYIEATAAIAAFTSKQSDNHLEMAVQLPQLVKRVDAVSKAKKRHAVDPKRRAKESALALWIERREGKHPKLRTTEQFAMEVMRRWPILVSSKVICGWSADWNKAVKAGKTPAC